VTYTGGGGGGGGYVSGIIPCKDELFHVEVLVALGCVTASYISRSTVLGRKTSAVSK
jgi:hypothetical protein